MSDNSTPNPGPTPTGYQRTTGGKGFKWQPPTAEHLSKLLPQYEIESILGHGGMGAVYKGKQKSLDRLVAIKILPPELDDEAASYVERFKNEAKVMAKFIHPAIVAVHDFGETSEGQLYIVMEYVDGTDVQKMILSQGRLPPDHALAITAHVCDALRYAHEHGVIHRDIKPANILINMEGAVKVADFGLAKADEAGSSGLTKTGMAMGTPDYVAPEALIMGVNVDGRADLYAVGVMLYNMLTGNVPRGAFKHASMMIPGVDLRFDQIVQKAMQMDRDERYQSAAEIRQDLDVILTTPLVQAGGQSSAAIPKASIAQKPVAKGPQQKTPPVKADAVSAAQAPVKASPLTWMLPTAVSAIVILGGAYYMGVKKPDVGDDVRSLSSSAGASEQKRLVTSSPTPAAPIKVKEEPKPAPTTISQSSEPQFPAGKWVKVFTKPEDLSADQRRSDSGVKFEDGKIILSKDKWLHLPPFRDRGYYAIRARVRRGQGDATTLVLGHTEPTQFLQFTRATSTGNLKLQWRLDEQTKTLGETLVNKPIASEAEEVVEFGLTAHTAFARSGEHQVVAKSPSDFPKGSAKVYGGDSIRDIEVMNLDGLSEAEALKILGVEAVGDDVRSLASPTPPPPTFPPGQWVKVLAEPSPLPSGAVRKEGWIFKPAPKMEELFRITDKLLTNLAFRATLNRGPDSGCSGRLGLRHHDTDGKGLFRAVEVINVFSSDPELSIQSVFEGSSTNQTLKKVRVNLPLETERRLEFSVVGGLIVLRIDNKVVAVAEDAKPHGGHILLSEFRGLIRDIEVINLDGLPEAEALRILGVDEKGNDLRALAVKQKLHMAEQAKEMDSLAAIPELKTLHDQLTKLATERVTSPFQADVAKLNNGYLGGIDRKIAEERGKGNLEGVLALEAEKKLIQGVTQGVTASSRQPSDPRRLAAEPRSEPVAPCPIPAEDDDKTTATLKGLRQIYRAAYAKLEATRDTNLKLLTNPLAVRLKKLEADLTKQNRIADALTVQGYRNTLDIAESSAAPEVIPANPTSAPIAQASDKTGADRRAAELVLKHGGWVTIEQSGKRTDIKGMAQMPVKAFDLVRIILNVTANSSLETFDDTQMMLLTGLDKVEFLDLRDTRLSSSFFNVCASWPKFKDLTVHIKNGTSLEPEAWEKLALLTKLERLDLSIQEPLSAKARQILIMHPRLSAITLEKNIDDAFVLQLSTMKQLRGLSIRVDPNVLKAGSISALAKLPNLERLALYGVGDHIDLDPIDFAGFRKLTNLWIYDVTLSQKIAKSLEGIRPLADELTLQNCILADDAVVRAVGLVETGNRLALNGCTFPENQLSAMHPKSAVRQLMFGHHYNGKVFNDLLPTLAGIKSLNMLILPQNAKLEVPIDQVKLADFRKARPDVKVVE